MIQYFGTSLTSAGHYFFELENNGMYSSRLNLSSVPFNPESLPFKDGKSSFPNGTVKYYQFVGFSICAIAGSCKDDRAGCKSIFFWQELLTNEEMKEKIFANATARKIIEQMPFQVNW